MWQWSAIGETRNGPINNYKLEVMGICGMRGSVPNEGKTMPTYQNVTPPLALSPGDVGYSWNSEAFPAANTAGTQFAIPSYAGRADTGFTLRWQTIFTGAPTAVSLVLQGAMSDIDAEYAQIDASTQQLGEARTVTGVQARFLRVKLVSNTGGTNITAKILV